MGVTFRTGDYIRHVYLGKRTVKDGEACAVWNDRGQHRQIDGPRRIWLYNSTVRFLTRHKAAAHQFLRVCHRDGRVEHVYGPASLYENPARHDEITVHDGICLNSETECIVVYGAAVSTEKPAEKEGNTTNGAMETAAPASGGGERERKIVWGPALFLPSEGETVHKFKWSGTNSGPTLIKGRNQFNVLKTGKNRTWDVTLPVTTSDLASFSVLLSFRYRIESLEKVLQVKDPFERKFAALRADGQVLGNGISSDQIRAGSNDSTLARLASLQSYPSLVAAAEAIGFALDSVTVTELRHSDELHGQATKEQQLAAKLRAEKAAKAQQRELYELDLDDRRRKIDQEAELQRQQAETSAKLEEELHATKEAAVERRLALERKETEARKQATEEEDTSVVEFLRALSDMGVDMTEFMCTAGGMKVGAAALCRATALRHSGGSKGKSATAEVGKAKSFPVPVAWEKSMA